MKFNPFFKFKGKSISLLLMTVASISSVMIIYYVFSSQTSGQNSLPTPSDSTVEPNRVAALGYLEPKGEVINLSAPAFAEGARVERLLVKVGDKTEEGQVVAILDSRDRLEAALKKAHAQVNIAKARLEQVEAGAQEGEIDAHKARIENLKAELQGQIAVQQATIDRFKAELEGEKEAQQATIERLKAELNNAETECARFERLYQNGAVTTSERDRICLESETASKRLTEAKVTLNRILNSRQKQIAETQAALQRTINTNLEQQTEAKATLEQIAEVRPVDVEVAKAALQDARASVQQAQADLDLAYVRSPITGYILKIHTRPGELVKNEGILELGQTEQMYVRAEVYETDITRVHLGQPAIITSQGFTGQLQGTVDEIGLQIGKKDVLGTDPVADIDARVVEVKIRLDLADSEKVAGLTNLQVEVMIEPSQDVSNTSQSLQPDSSQDAVNKAISATQLTQTAQTQEE